MPRFVIRTTVSSYYAVFACGVRREGRYYRFFDEFGETVFKIGAKSVLEVAPQNEYPCSLARGAEDHLHLGSAFGPCQAMMGRAWFV